LLAVPKRRYTTFRQLAAFDLAQELKDRLTASPYDASGNPTKEYPGE